MPGYAGIGRANLLRENHQEYLWINETVPVGLSTSQGLSRAVQLERVRSSYYPWGFSLEAVFASAPGAFEIDVMVADTDNPTYFVPWTTITQVNAFNVGRVDVLNSWAKYVAVYMKTLGNTGLVSVKITR
jgi:hypothetical protein